MKCGKPHLCHQLRCCAISSRHQAVCGSSRRHSGVGVSRKHAAAPRVEGLTADTFTFIFWCLHANVVTQEVWGINDLGLLRYSHLSLVVLGKHLMITFGRKYLIACVCGVVARWTLAAIWICHTFMVEIRALSKFCSVPKDISNKGSMFSFMHLIFNILLNACI